MGMTACEVSPTTREGIHTLSAQFHTQQCCTKLRGLHLNYKKKVRGGKKNNFGGQIQKSVTACDASAAVIEIKSKHVSHYIAR